MSKTDKVISLVLKGECGLIRRNNFSLEFKEKVAYVTDKKYFIYVYIDNYENYYLTKIEKEDEDKFIYYYELVI